MSNERTETNTAEWVEVSASIASILDKAGWNTSEALASGVEMAALGRQYEAELRAEAKKEAIRAYGADKGVKIGASVDHLSADVIKDMRDSWRTEADAKFGFNGSGDAPARASVPTAMPNVAVVDGAKPRRGWDMLTAEQRKLAAKMGATTVEKQDAFAANMGLVTEGIN